jgi:hypothetical protein
LSLLKDVNEKLYTNISLQGLYGKVFGYLREIVREKLNLVKVLIDKSSDLYELRLLYLMISRWGNVEELKKKIEDIGLLIDLKEDDIKNNNENCKR